MNNFTVGEHAQQVSINSHFFLSLYPETAAADNVEDNEDKNLSWLFNFKLDEIANLSPEIKRKRTNTNHQQQHVDNHQQNFYNPSQHQQQQQQYDDGNQQRSAKDPCIEDDLNVAENIVISNAPSYTSTHM